MHCFLAVKAERRPSRYLGPGALWSSVTEVARGRLRGLAPAEYIPPRSIQTSGNAHGRDSDNGSKASCNSKPNVALDARSLPLLRVSRENRSPKSKGTCSVHTEFMTLQWRSTISSRTSTLPRSGSPAVHNWITELDGFDDPIEVERSELERIRWCGWKSTTINTLAESVGSRFRL